MFRSLLSILLLGIVIQLGGPTLAQGAAAEALPYDVGSGMIAGAKAPNPAPTSGTDTIVVNAGAVVRQTKPQVLGINTNYLTDNATARNGGQGYTAALQQLGVKSLRYPEGEMADEYLWSSAPFTAPAPTLARTGPNEWPSNDPRWVQNYTTFTNAPLNFDEFMAYARTIGAQPTLVVAFDSMYKPATAGGTAPSKQLLLDTAVAWVRYANIVKGYGVKRWEIGNESYLNAYNGGATAKDYARDLVEFSRAMKAVDPTIEIGANGPDRIDARGDLDSQDLWWQTVLQRAAPDIDFLAVHSYPAWQWGSYEYYQSNTPSLTGGADAAVSALRRWAPRDAARIQIAVTEMNSADWSKGGWASEGNNTLGHALVLFEMLGSYLQHPQVDMAQVWNTRWIDPAHADLWDTLDGNNGLRASGKAMAIWGQFMRPSMVQASNTAMIHSFASLDPASGQLNIFLINKDTRAHPTNVALTNYASTATAAVWQLRGTGSEDANPTWGAIGALAVSGGSATLTLAPVSVTVLSLTPTGGILRTGTALP